MRSFNDSRSRTMSDTVSTSQSGGARSGTANAFRFIDLFAGIGGFHGALGALGGLCVWASEIDERAAFIYERNWGARPVGDIVSFTDPQVSDKVPRHDVLCAGFPCQPFSKSGKQEGFRDTTRGTLFFNICQVLDARRPAVVFLENVRNLAGPRQRETWATIVRELRNLGYRVSDEPTVFSPHLLPPELGGTPQIRERVFIVGTYVGRDRAWSESDVQPVVRNEPVAGFDPQFWSIADLLQPDSQIDDLASFRVNDSERLWIDAWNDFVVTLRGARGGQRLPGFPLWADDFVVRPRIPAGTPDWKADFLVKNSAFYRQHRAEITAWKKRWNGLREFPTSRRKLEWQAQDTESLWDCVIHLRPSGIRAKRPTYLPALVAITQTSIIGPRSRRITPNEAKRLQGLPPEFSFAGQRDAESYKQLGNAVAVGAAYHVLRQHVLNDRRDLLTSCPSLVEAVEASGEKPVVRLSSTQIRD